MHVLIWGMLTGHAQMHAGKCKIKENPGDLKINK